MAKKRTASIDECSSVYTVNGRAYRCTLGDRVGLHSNSTWLKWDTREDDANRSVSRCTAVSETSGQCVLADGHTAGLHEAANGITHTYAAVREPLGLP